MASAKAAKTHSSIPPSPIDGPIVEHVYQQAIAKAKTNHTSIPEEMISIPPMELHDELPWIFEDAPAIQQAVLAEIIHRSQGSAWADAHEMQNITPAQWRESAPITEYEDYRPFIDAEVGGLVKELFNAPIDAIIATTGSTGEAKYFLESRAGTMAKMLIMRTRGIYLRTSLPVTGDMESKNLTISNYAPVGKSAKGLDIVRASGQTARNMRVKTGTMNILPESFWLASELTPSMRDYMMGAFALGDVRFSKVFCNNLIHFGRILDCIAEEAPRMIFDIRRGAFDVKADEPTRKALAPFFPARPERADELEAILEHRGSLVDTPDAIAETWPNLQMVSCWMSASVGRDAREVLRRLPHRMRCHEMGYGSSEAKLAIPLHTATASGACAPCSQFYEFLPLDAPSNNRPLCMWEVEPDRYYELVITTYSGLYRYNMNDIVHIDGFVGNTPLITFSGKSSEFIDSGKCRIYSCYFAEIAMEVERASGIEFDFMQILPAEDSWFWLLETKEPADWSIILRMLNEQSKARWGMQSQGIYVMAHDYKERLFTARTRQNRGACGIKLSIVRRTAPSDDGIMQVVLSEQTVNVRQLITTSALLSRRD